jgi:hypothetical protein
MAEEWRPDAILKAKTSQIKLEFFDYIEKNIDRIDANIPVFFGQVAATLDTSLPGIPDDMHDQFINSLTMKVLESSKKSGDIAAVEKLFDYAIRNMRGRKGRAIYDIILGLRMVTDGRFADAISHLKRYRNVDAILCPAIAYCYYTLSTRQPVSEGTPSPALPGDLKLAAREQMMELVTLKPPVNRLKNYEVTEDAGITKIFWFMLKHAIEWFPSEREFLRIGVEKATKDRNTDIREELLTIAIERFCNDMHFLREMYFLKLEQRDAGGLAGVVKQMTQQFPDDIEPVYYGLRLAVMASRGETYSRFRKLAVSRNFPPNVLLLSDFAFELMSGRQHEARACLDEIKQKFGPHHFYVMMLDYVVSDFFSDDQKKEKKAKKVLIDSLDQYCMKILKIKPT